MSIQRYAFDSFGPSHPGGVIIHDPDGVYVTYADHVQAVAEAEAEFVRMENAWRDEVDRRERAAWEVADRKVRENTLREALAAVEDRRVPWPTTTGDLVNEGIDEAIAAIQRLIDGEA